MRRLSKVVTSEIEVGYLCRNMVNKNYGDDTLNSMPRAT